MLKAVTGFGGGVGARGSMCGVISGSVIEARKTLGLRPAPPPAESPPPPPAPAQDAEADEPEDPEEPGAAEQ